MKQGPVHILIIDDDEINNFIAAKLIAKIPVESVVNTCLNGLDGLNYVKGKLENQAEFPDIIFLDINMPVMNGWEFLDHYNQIKSEIDKEVTINMLSSSVYNDDINKAETYTTVNKFISKPLSVEKIQNIFDSLKITS